MRRVMAFLGAAGIVAGLSSGVGWVFGGRTGALIGPAVVGSVVATLGAFCLLGLAKGLMDYAMDGVWPWKGRR